jgi:hypothetical protein
MDTDRLICLFPSRPTTRVLEADGCKKSGKGTSYKFGNASWLSTRKQLFGFGTQSVLACSSASESLFMVHPFMFLAHKLRIITLNIQHMLMCPVLLCGSVTHVKCTQKTKSESLFHPSCRCSRLHDKHTFASSVQIFPSTPSSQTLSISASCFRQETKLDYMGRNVLDLLVSNTV